MKNSGKRPWTRCRVSSSQPECHFSTLSAKTTKNKCMQYARTCMSKYSCDLHGCFPLQPIHHWLIWHPCFSVYQLFSSNEKSGCIFNSVLSKCSILENTKSSFKIVNPHDKENKLRRLMCVYSLRFEAKMFHQNSAQNCLTPSPPLKLY